MRFGAGILTMGLFAALLGGCSFDQMGRYFYDRMADAADCGRAGIAFGRIGLQGSATLTQYVEVGAGSYNEAGKIGFLGRRGGYWLETRDELAFFTVWYYHLQRVNQSGNILDHDDNILKRLSAVPGRPFEDPTWLFDLNGYLGVAGLELGVDPYQFIDFVIGFTTYDLADDDIFSTPVNSPEFRKKLDSTQYGRGSTTLPPSVNTPTQAIPPAPGSGAGATGYGVFQPTSFPTQPNGQAPVVVTPKTNATTDFNTLAAPPTSEVAPPGTAQNGLKPYDMNANFAK